MMDGATSVGTGATEGVVMALSAALAAELALTTPDERRRIGVPATRGLFEPAHNLLRGGRRLPFERAAGEDALDRLGHVQPGAAERGVQRHDAAGDQPEDQARGLVA